MTAQRYAAGLEYDGTHFYGWQVQGRVRSVQEALNAALGVVADEPVATLAAGRTDAGVHATGQVVHFESGASRSLRSWLLGVNSNLPPDVALTWIQPVPAEFHARHSAVGRTYRYLIRNRDVRSPLDRDHAWCLRGELCERRMASAAPALLGEHDFSAFRGAGCQARSPVRRIDHLTVTRAGEWLDVEVRANGFLYHMVRNIVGALVRVGRGEEEPTWLADVLAGRDRRRGAATAPPNGLYLAAVNYPDSLRLPAPAPRPAWRAG